MNGFGPIERELTTHLLALNEAYREATGAAEATVAEEAAGDWRFFERLREPKPTFTARKCDAVMVWFARNWPKDVRWPKGVPPRAKFLEAESESEPA